jgi:NitT/TauT family transport system substrate-binding protein
MKTASLLFAAATLVAVASQTPAAAQDVLKIAVPQRGAWDTSISEIGERAGIFKKHDVNVELLFTGGGAEAQGAIISGQLDIAVSVGISTVLGIYAKGGPVRIFSAETTGQPDIYWFVPAASPVKTFADLKGKTMGYSVAGSSSHAALLALLAQENLDAKPTPVGGVTPSFTAGMTGQIDAAWSTIPIGLKEIDEGRIRVIARAADIKSLQNRTVRVNMASAATLEKKKAVADRYMAAYRETIDYMYSSPEALVTFAEIAKVPLAVAQKIPGLVPKSALNPDQIIGMDAIMAEAVATKFMAAPLPKDKIAELVQMPLQPK